MSFLDVLAESELWVGELRAVRLACGRVLLLRTDAGVFAYEDRCPHLGLPLSQGTLEGDTLTCSAHQFQFHASTGQGKNPSCLRLRAYPVVLEAGMIRVNVAPLEREPSELRPSELRPCHPREGERRGR